MAIKRTKRSAEEKLTPANIEKVISLLESEKPITKKDACAILNITYNTTRLGNIIEKFKEDKERDAKHRAEKRGKPVTTDEAAFIIQAYLEGTTVDSISKTTYRGPGLIKQTLEKYACPIRARIQDYFKPELIPEEAMRDRFNIGEKVYSARYDSIAKIISEQFQKGQWIYNVWLESEKQQQFAYQEASELASLEHLKALGVKF
jgi:hypothetical protein